MPIAKVNKEIPLIRFRCIMTRQGRMFTPIVLTTRSEPEIVLNAN